MSACKTGTKIVIDREHITYEEYERRKDAGWPGYDKRIDQLIDCPEPEPEPEEDGPSWWRP